MIDPNEHYFTGLGVPDVDAVIEAYHKDAAAFRERHVHKSLDVAYGPRTRNDVDIFWPSDAAADRHSEVPIVVFIHGGYWRRFDRRTFSHLAEGLVRKGVAVAMPSYTLAPEVGVGEIITEMRSCMRFLNQTFGRKLTAIGHSAGGHLAACMFATDWAKVDPTLPADLVPSGFAISGIFDLEPLLGAEANETLGLDRETARAVSPLRDLPPALRRFDAWVGRREAPGFHEQSRDLVRRWGMTGALCEHHVVPNANHFNVVDPLRNPRSRMVKHILHLAAHPEGEKANEPEQKPKGASVEL